MKKSRFAGILASVLLLLTLSPMALAEETQATEETLEATEETKAPSSLGTSGTCGDGLTWELSGSTLTISGSGPMAESASWAEYKDKIKTVVLTGGVTTVAPEAFAGCEKITGVDFGDSLKEIQKGAFRDCLGLTAISLPATFRLFGVESFYGCSNLETIHCAGGMPSFKGNCLWNGNYITIYRPVNNPWPEEAVETLVNNFGGRLEVLAASSDAPQPPVVKVAETTPKETEAPTVPTTAPTAPPTQPPVTTPPVTEETAPQTTQAPVETTEAVVYTLPTMATQPQEPEEETGGLNGGIIGILLIVGVLTFFLVGALIARGISRRRYEE